MYEESAISILRKLPENKSQANNFVRLVRESIEGGEVDTLLAYKNISMLEHVFKKLKGDLIIRDVALEAAEKFNQKSFDYSGAKFTIKEVGSTYKYENCNDTVWSDLNEKIKELTIKKKEREAFLKTIKPGMEIYNEEGTLINPPVHSSETMVTVTLK